MATEEKINYSVDTTTKPFTDITNAENAEIADLRNQYGLQADGSIKGGLIGDADKIIQDQMSNLNDYKNEQIKNQNERLDFELEKIEQEKDKVEKDYEKEQSAAWADYQKLIDPYGVNAEQMAAQGLSNTGYSESSRIRAYVSWQNRVATARASFEQAKINFSNQMQEAKLQNNALLAEIAYNTLVEQSKLALEQITTRSTLISDLTTQKNQTRSYYQTKWKDELDRVNAEIRLREEARQFDENYKLDERQIELAEKKFDFEKKQYNDSKSESSGGSGTLGAASLDYGKDTGSTSSGEITDYSYEATVAREENKNKKLNYASLNNAMRQLEKMGLPCKNHEQLDAYIRKGLVVEYEKNGTLYYKTSYTPIKNAYADIVKRHFGLDTSKESILGKTYK